MDTTVCPACRKTFAITPAHLGKRCRCPRCGAVFVVEPPAPAPRPGLRPAPVVETEMEPEPVLVPVSNRPGPAPGVFPVKIFRDPERALSGVFEASAGPKGVRLTRKGHPGWFLPVGTPVISTDRSKMTVELDGRVVELAAGKLNLYNARLVRDLAAYLRGQGPPPRAENYTIPTSLLVAAFLPAGIAFAGLAGGAIGGGVCGGIAGGIITGTLAVVRREDWSVGARLAACVGISLLGYGAFAGVVALALMLLRPADVPDGSPAVASVPPAPPVWPVQPPPRPLGPGAPADVPPPGFAAPAPAPGRRPAPPAGQEVGWGTFEDPDGDSRFVGDGRSATMTVPGTLHDLTGQAGRTNAPRVLRAVPGDFTARVRVVGTVIPSAPPVAGSNVAFHGAGVLVWDDGRGFFRLERAAFVRDGAVQEYVLSSFQPTGGFAVEENRPYGGGPVHLRVDLRGGTLSPSFSTDGVSWQTLTPRTYPAARPRVGVAAVNTAAAPFTARFEGLTVEGR